MVTETNIDKLHDVIDGKTGARHCGKTYARCHQAAGYVETGMERIYFFVSTPNHISNAMLLLHGVFLEHELEFKVIQHNKLIQSGDCLIRFLVHNDTNFNMKMLEGSTGVIIRDTGAM